MRTMRLCAIVTLGFALGYAFADAGDADKKKVGEGGKAKCCMKAEKDGKTCSHQCCVDGAKEGKNCEACGGHNKAKDKKTESAPAK
jgi:hypothetical protein